MDVPLWEPGTQYNYGDIVEYRARYKVIFPHRSQRGWAPPIVSSLWSHIPDDRWEEHQRYSPPHVKGDYNGQDVHQPDDCSWHPRQTAVVPHEEHNDNRKKQVEIGGGPLAGATTIGAGYHTWNEVKEKKTEEEKRALTWGLQGSQRDAYVRTEESRGPRAPMTWVPVDGRDKIPSSAIEAGKDKDGHPIYIARAYYNGGIHIGRASPLFKEGSVIGYGGRAIELSKFEVLMGDSRAIRWVEVSNALNVRALNARPVEGGKDGDGSQLYVARVRFDGGVHAAKVGENLPAAHLAFNGKEIIIYTYEVLCLN